MSPLARSLLALAALLAAADADDQGYDGVTEAIGRVTNYVQPLSLLDLRYGLSEIELENYCPPPMHLVGEKITVCNKTPNHRHPDVHAREIVEVTCYDHSGCTVSILEYCGY
ncbi:uncharacterized protein LOC134664082 [Cydia fagiglandana]|uniref:uncharacterized protein LOC134664082 n=1 Tax=Cydia fagiglandana TaxID=1458189 RepID=UPI002FEE51FE